MIKYFPSENLFSSEWISNVLWIEVTPKKLAEQMIQTSNIVQLKEADDLDISHYNFLAPQEFQENINNIWEPMENVISGFSQKVASSANIVSQWTTTFKVDTPLIYKNTDRREVSFLFNLVMDKEGNSKEYVTEPVKNLMKWSTPQVSTEIIQFTGMKIELPYVFQVRTKKGEGDYQDIINMRAAAISSIQPTYYHPYINGHPCRCELTVTFQDIEPISRDRTFNITVS